MITRINARNAPEYQRLFAKATALIKENEAITLPAGMEWEDFSITTLNQYFAYLKDITGVFDEEDIVSKAFYVRLPLDEEFLNINADTRAISVPASFARSGVGVQGDESAEILYFKIDRYFDFHDLASDDIKIAIQWEAKDVNKQVIKGFTSNFGKDIETVPGSIIFGWPITGELTQTNGTIKFAVRFYSIGVEEDRQVFTYSFMTLPAEITINQTLDYNLLANSDKELDYGKAILGRINNSGIYDPSFPIPEEPIITTNLFATAGENTSTTIIDLPANGSGIQLAVAAKPVTQGVIEYKWKKFAYNTETSDYNKDASILPSEDVSIEYAKEVEDIPVNTQTLYYEFDSKTGAYIPVVLSDFKSEDGVYAHYNSGFGLANDQGEYKELYKQFSCATVTTVGKYGVEIYAKILTNTTKSKAPMDIITIPGPLKPVVNENVTENRYHEISDNGAAVTLTVEARPGEDDKSASEVGQNPQVSLKYNWKKVINDNGDTQDIIEPPIMPVSVLPTEQLPADEQWQENAAENGAWGAKGAFNQEHSIIVQHGTRVEIYTSEELKEFNSTDPEQGTHKWLALDIDTGKHALAGTVWNDNYTFTEEDENELGVANGHILFWLKADESLVARTIDGTTLTFEVISGMPSEPYFNTDKTQMTVPNLASSGLDVKYLAEITATRNNVSTIETSSVYRITNSPVKPVIKVREYDRNENKFKFVEKDYLSSDNVRISPATVTNPTPVLSFSVDPITNSDQLSYIWMRVRIDENDLENGSQKLQVDLDNIIPGLEGLFAPAGDPDFIVENNTYETAVKVLPGLPVLDEEANADNGPSLTIQPDYPDGYYYCVVINRLNGHVQANVSPFFSVTHQ